MNIISHPDEAGLGGSLVPRTAHLVPLPAGGDVDDVPPIIHYWRIINRRKWVVVGSIVTALIIGAILTILATPQYVATATVEISREVESTAGVEGMTEQPTNDQEFYQTQYGLLRSRSLARRVAEQLNLPNNPEMRDYLGLNARFALFSSDDKGALSPAEREELLDAAETALLGRVTVAPTVASRLVDLKVSSPDPKFSALVANTWVEGFIKSSLERRFGSASYARDFLETRLDQVRARLEDAERKLVAYASQQGIVNLNSDATGTEGAREQSLAANNLALLNAELATATADRMRAESRLRQAGTNASSESIANQALSVLRQKRAQAAADYAQMLSDFEPGYPKARALKSQLDAFDAAIAAEEGRVGGSIRQEYASALSRENQLKARVKSLTGDVLDLRRRSIQYNIYKRDVDTSRTLYEGLLQRYKEIGIAGGVGRNNIAVVDPAKAPEAPSSPNPVLNMLIALIAGTVAGLGLALGLQQIDQAITDPDELTRRLGIPLLGAIARAEGDDPLAALADRNSGLAEGYMTVRTNLEFSTPSGVPRSIVVTSSRPAEGKTTSSLALAVVLARLGSRVLLVDGDMRSPSIHRMLQMKNEGGLSNFLSGHAKLEELIRPTHVEGLSTIVAGPPPPNAAELLAGNHLEEFLAAAAKRFDHVIVDAPPVLGLADAPLLGARAEAVIFVVEARGTKTRIAERSLARLRATHARVLGGILTKFEPKFAPEGYGEEYGYSYGKAVARVA